MADGPTKAHHAALIPKPGSADETTATKRAARAATGDTDWIFCGTAAGRPEVVAAILARGLGAAAAQFRWPEPIVIAGFAVTVVIGVLLLRSALERSDVGANKARSETDPAPLNQRCNGALY